MHRRRRRYGCVAKACKRIRLREKLTVHLLTVLFNVMVFVVWGCRSKLSLRSGVPVLRYSYGSTKKKADRNLKSKGTKKHHPLDSPVRSHFGSRINSDSVT